MKVLVFLKPTNFVPGMEDSGAITRLLADALYEYTFRPVVNLTDGKQASRIAAEEYVAIRHPDLNTPHRAEHKRWKVESVRKNASLALALQSAVLQGEIRIVDKTEGFAIGESVIVDRCQDSREFQKGTIASFLTTSNGDAVYLVRFVNGETAMYEEKDLKPVP